VPSAEFQVVRDKSEVVPANSKWLRTIPSGSGQFQVVPDKFRVAPEKFEVLPATFNIVPDDHQGESDDIQVSPGYSRWFRTNSKYLRSVSTLFWTAGQPRRSPDDFDDCPAPTGFVAVDHTARPDKSEALVIGVIERR
jgi:hypothetical protein